MITGDDRKYYSNNDHEQLRNYLLKNQEYKWILSYDYNTKIKELYNSFIHKKVLSLDQHANYHKENTELLVCSNSIKWPW